MGSRLVCWVCLIGVLSWGAGAALAEMVAYYPLNEGQGTVAIDASGNGHDGVAANGDPTWVAGQDGFGTALYWNGQSPAVGYINCGTWNPSEVTGQLSAAIWAKWDGPLGNADVWQGVFAKRQSWADSGDGSQSMWEIEIDASSNICQFFRGGSYPGNGSYVLPEGEWAHICATFDGTTQVWYADGQETGRGGFSFGAKTDSTITIGCDNGDGWNAFNGTLDDARLYDHALTPDEVLIAMSPGAGPKLATSAKPAGGATDVPREVVLSWNPSDYAATHDVYFGTAFEDVSAADRANPLGVLVSQGQTTLTHDPEGLLDFGQIYYWRVDEVNGAPDYAIFKGDVWIFTVEPYVYPIANITATASSSHNDDMGPAKTIDGSGLNAGDQHSTAGTDMWLSGPGEAWIQYEFDRVYVLDEMWVWNSNQAIEAFVGFGIKGATVEYSVDGVDWTVMDGVTEFAQAPGSATYTHNTTVDFGGASAKYVKITANSNWGVLGQYSLSEVRFFYLPVHARAPQPASGAMDVGLDAVLSWRPGRKAGAHEIYFSSDRAAVVDGTAQIASVSETTYDPGLLEYGRMYYWAINEANAVEAASPWVGAIWSFSTVESTIIEDMESYDDDLDGGTAIFQTWIDGWDNGSGATVGYFQAPFAEQRIVNGGRQAMPLDYNNVNSPWYSETERTWDSPQNWTLDGADTLIVHFQGNAPGFIETAPGAFTMGAAGADIWGNSDEFRYAYKRLSGDGSIVARVESIANTDVWAKAGVMIRESLDADSKHGFVAVTPASSLSFQRRLITGDVSSSTDAAAGLTAPYWVKLTRTGNTFTAARSADGATWVPMTDDAAASSITIEMIGNAYIGLAVTSHSPGNSTIGEFSNVSTTGNVTGSWQALAIGVEQPANDPAPLYVALEDSSGKLAVVTHPDAEAVLAASWQEWAIPLSDFTGVNATKVEKMIIGVGDRDNPTPDGAGLLYIDDIAVGHLGLVDPGPSGLVAYYALENDANDSSGNAPDGIAVGDPVYIDGMAGNGMALEFDGAGGQYVDLGTFNPSAGTGQLSVSLWTKWNGLTSFYQGLIGKRDSWAASDMMWQIEAEQAGGQVRFQREGIDIPAVVLPVGEWTHVMATFDGARARVYVDGLLAGEGDFSLGTDPTAAMQFGACEANGGNPFNGALDEIRIYNRALSPFEIRYLSTAK